MDFSQFYAGEKEICDVFRTLGAVSPASARPVKDLQVDPSTFDRLLRRGVIREGAPGTFYLYEPAPAPSRWIRQLIFWVFVIIIPIVVIQFCARPH